MPFRSAKTEANETLNDPLTTKNDSIISLMEILKEDVQSILRTGQNRIILGGEYAN